MQKRAKKSSPKFSYPTQILWRADRDGKITYLNRQWQDCTGFSVQESLGLNFIRAISISDRDRFLSQWQQARDKQESTEIECTIKDKQGIDRPFIFVGEPFKMGSQDEICEWIGTFTSIEPISAIKANQSTSFAQIFAPQESEITLKENKPECYTVVDRDSRETKESKTDIAQARFRELCQLNIILFKIIALLEKRNQQLDRFSYLVSHDLKAPLRGIATLAEWIEQDLKDRLSSQTRLYLRLLGDRLRRMINLINGLLDYSRIDRVKVKPELVDVNILLKEVIDSLAPPSNFKIEIVGEMPVFTTERLLLERVFSNLIDNAIKHHNRPNGKIKIFVVNKENFYEFIVADNGPGISPEERERIFVIFQTLAVEDELQNTGIGLSIVKKILEDRGDKIELVSQLGRGSIFRFTWYKN